MGYLIRHAQDAARDLTADESREYHALDKILDGLDNMPRRKVVHRSAIFPGGTGETSHLEGQPLAAGQTFAGFARDGPPGRRA